MKEMTRKEIETILEGMKVRKGWQQGVLEYAYIILAPFGDEEEFFPKGLKKKLLNGAENWEQYSYGGCALIYDYDIAETLCTEKGLERCKHGEKNPNSRESWLDVQARALRASYMIINKIVNRNTK